MKSRSWLPWLLAALAIAQAIFASVPSIDIRVSRLFYAEGRGFWIATIPFVITLREWLRMTPWVVAFIAGAVAVVQGLRRGRVGLGSCLLICVSLALGPGLLVNGVLKSYWGRARPDAIEQFGGPAHFTPAFQIARECLRNCSFTSGEAASLSTAAMALSVALWSARPGRVRIAAILAVCAVAAGGSFLRVMMGRHFLSDVVFSVLFCALIVLGVKRLIDLARGGPAG